MARLPDIQYQTYSPSNPGSPDQAVQNSNQKVALVNQALDGAQTIMDAHRKFVVTESAAGYSDEMSAFRQHAETMDVISQAEAMALNKEYGINLNEEKPQLNKAEWYPALLAKKMDIAREKYAEKIGSNIDKREFTNTVKANENAMLEQEIARAQSQTAEYLKNEEVAKIEDRMLANDYIGANALIEASTTYQNQPQAKALAQHKLYVQEKTSRFNTALMTAKTIEDFDSILNTVTDTGWNEGIPSDEVLKMAASTITQRNQYLSMQSEGHTDMVNEKMNEMQIRAYEGTLTPAEINDAARTYGFKASDTRALQNSLATQAGGGGKSDATFMQNFGRTLTEVKTGVYEVPAGQDPKGYGGGDMKQVARELYQALSEAQSSVDPVSGEVKVLVSPSDAVQLRNQIASIETAPYQSEEYKSVLAQIKATVNVTETGGGVLPFTTDDSKQRAADAAEALRVYVETNGGARADLTKWRQNSLPVYMSAIAQAGVLGLDKDMSNYLVAGTNAAGTFVVDDGATTEKMLAAQKSYDIKASQGEDVSRFQDNLKSLVNKYDAWKKDPRNKGRVQ